MSEMIEKVARALTEVQIRSANELFKLSDPRKVKTEEQIMASIDASWGMNAKDARAAIEAMREPTDLMGLGLPSGYRPGTHSATQIWSAMIDAALKSKDVDRG